MIQNKRAKIKQDIGDAPLNNLRKGPGVHEASLRRYGSKLVYHITVFFFIYISYSYLQIQHIDTINVLYHFTSYIGLPPVQFLAGLY